LHLARQRDELLVARREGLLELGGGLLLGPLDPGSSPLLLVLEFT
jgi:hypothetical protein